MLSYVCIHECLIVITTYLLFWLLFCLFIVMILVFYSFPVLGTRIHTRINDDHDDYCYSLLIIHYLSFIIYYSDETFRMDPTKFIVIYPSYLDSMKTIKQGRRIGKDEAVDTPTVSDISSALQMMGMRHVLQPYKGYSRDITALWDNPGRVKVDYSSDDDGNKRTLLKALAEKIPTLPQRIQRLEHAAKEAKIAEEKAIEEAVKQREQQQQLVKQKQQAAATKVNNKKKGKKKR